MGYSEYRSCHPSLLPLFPLLKPPNWSEWVSHSIGQPSTQTTQFLLKPAKTSSTGVHTRWLLRVISMEPLLHEIITYLPYYICSHSSYSCLLHVLCRAVFLCTVLDTRPSRSSQYALSMTCVTWAESSLQLLGCFCRPPGRWLIN